MQFTTILHPVRKQFALSCNEYCIADMIDKLASPNAPVPGWCNASPAYMAEEMGLSRQSVFTIIQSLIAKKLIDKKGSKLLQPTVLWLDVVAICKESLQSGVKNLDKILAETVKKVYSNCKESLQPNFQESLQKSVKNLDTYNKSENKTIENKIENTQKVREDDDSIVEVEAEDLGNDSFDAENKTPNPVAAAPSPVVIPVDPFRRKSAAQTVNVPFFDWWSLYDKGINETRSRQLWIELTDQERLNAIAHTPLYVASTPSKQYRKNPETYLELKVFNDEIIERHERQHRSNQHRQRPNESREQTGSTIDELVKLYGYGT